MSRPLRRSTEGLYSKLSGENRHVFAANMSIKVQLANRKRTRSELNAVNRVSFPSKPSLTERIYSRLWTKQPTTTLASWTALITDDEICHRQIYQPMVSTVFMIKLSPRKTCSDDSQELIKMASCCLKFKECHQIAWHSKWLLELLTFS